MADVADASNNQQRPALYTDFARTVHFLPEMVNPVQNVQTQPAIEKEIPGTDDKEYSGNLPITEKPIREKRPLTSKFSFISSNPIGMYFDASFLGGLNYSFGIGMSIFDIAKIQANFGMSTPGTRFGGQVFSGKILVNIFYFNFNNWLKTGIAFGGHIAWFKMEVHENPVILPQFIGQWELLRADMSHFVNKWKYFKSFSLYAEPGLWFSNSYINSDPNAWRLRFTICLGLRISLF